MIEFVVLAFFVTVGLAVLFAFASSIRLSAARKAAGDTDEVLLSTWREWDRPTDRYTPMYPVGDDMEPDTPAYGVIRIQAR